MGIRHELAKYMVEEFAEKGKRISYKLAWYVARVKDLDGLIWLATRDKLPKEEILAFVGVSERFLEISIKVHCGAKEDGWKVGYLEQIAEVRAQAIKNFEIEEDKELFEKESTLRLYEKLTAVRIFLEESDYSAERIADLVGVPVSFVDKNRVLKAK